MYKFIYIILMLIIGSTNPTLGLVMFIVGYIGLVIKGMLPEKQNKYKKRFEQIINKRTTYIVDDYGTDTTTRKSCE